MATDIELTDVKPERIRKHPYAKCERCPLVGRPYVPDLPVENPDMIFVGEAPGETEVQQGRPFVGPSGKLLAQGIVKAGGNLQRVSRHNTVACRPPENRTPTDEEIDCCAPRLEYELRKQPIEAPIVALGKTPSLLMLDWSGEDRNMKISERMGRWFNWGGRRWLATWHPAYVLRSPADAPALLTHLKRAYAGEQKEDIVKEPEVIHIDSFEELQSVCEKVANDEWVAFDIETDQVHWYDRPGEPKDTIIAFGFAWKTTFGVAVDPDIMYDDDRVVPYLNEFMGRVKLCAHNGKFDTIFLRTGMNLLVRLDFDFDTMLAHYALDEQPGRQGLKGIAFEEFGIPNYEERIIAQYLRSSNDYYSKIPYDKLCLYMIWDVTVTLRLRELFEERLRAAKLHIRQGSSLYEWPFKNLLMPAQAALAQVELSGVHIDRRYLEAQGERLLAEAERYADKFRGLVGEPNLNLNSAPQKSRLFYDELRFPDPGRNEARNRNAIKSRSTNKQAVEKIREMLKESGRLTPELAEILDTLRHYQRVQKMNSSYVKNVLNAASVEDTVHASYKVIGTETGRLSAVDPAIQTIPRPDDRYGAIIRSAFVAPPGKKFVIVDYSQGELRVAAGLSKDPFLLQVYEEGRDLHSEVAVAMYGEKFTKAQRVLCKMFNFSYLYGGTEHSFAEAAGLPLGQAVAFVQNYNRVMPGLARWKESMVRFAQTYSFVETIFGRRRRFPVLNSRAMMEEMRKAAVNMPVQSTMSDFNLISGIRMVEAGYDLAILVHDSLVLRADEDKAEEVAAAAVKMLVSVGEEFLPEVRWDADAEIVDRWCQTPAEYVRSHVTLEKLDDLDELKKLLKWVKGEDEAEALLTEAINEPCISRRGELVARAATSLEV